jgi:hypothetical protein
VAAAIGRHSFFFFLRSDNRRKIALAFAAGLIGPLLVPARNDL